MIKKKLENYTKKISRTRRFKRKINQKTSKDQKIKRIEKQKKNKNQYQKKPSKDPRYLKRKMKKKKPPKIKSKNISRFRRLIGKRTKKIYQKSIPKKLKKKIHFPPFSIPSLQGCVRGERKYTQKKNI
jgi:hypothetical protein